MAPQPNANGNWFVNKHTGEIKHITNFFEKMWYEGQSGTWESFGTQADAQAFAAAIKAHNTNPAAPSPVKDWWLNTQDGTITHDPGADLKPPWMAFASKADAEAYLKAHPAQTPLQQLGNGISSLSGAVLAPLFQGNIWIRAAQIGIGIILIAVGVAKLTNAVPVATKLAKYVA